MQQIIGAMTTVTLMQANGQLIMRETEGGFPVVPDEPEPAPEPEEEPGDGE